MQLLQGVKSLGRPCKYIYICDMCRQGLTPLYEGNLGLSSIACRTHLPVRHT